MVRGYAFEKFHEELYELVDLNVAVEDLALIENYNK
jgi:hypothetical protein